ncbi:MAG: hypothetical protein U0Y68_27190 [Blastocatellia bacterium]
MNKTIQECIAEVEREISTRRRVYPAWVDGGKIKADVADHRIDCLQTTLGLLQEMACMSPGAQPDLFTPPKLQPKHFPPQYLAKSVSELATPKQIVLIRSICLDLDIDVDMELQETIKLDCKVEELSRRAASSFIDHLKQLQEGTEIPIVRRAS